MKTMTRFFGVAHVRWELPFPLRLPSATLSCWEPQFGIALFESSPRVGVVQWRRRTDLLSAGQVFGDRVLEEPTDALPSRSYKVAAVVVGGKEFHTTKLLPGIDGGFDEAVAYSVANVFLAVKTRAEFSNGAPKERAIAAINNILAGHALVAGDGNTRVLRPELDSYYTVTSLAVVPSQWQQMTAAELLGRIEELQFSAEMGKGRHHNIGIGTADDFTQGGFTDSGAQVLLSRIKQRLEIPPYQSLILSAIRRLVRRDAAQAIVDGYSAVEVCVGDFLRRSMLETGSTEEQVENAFTDRLSGLQNKIVQLDKNGAILGGGQSRFENCPEHLSFTRVLGKLRHSVVHRGLREVPFPEAHAGLVAGTRALAALESRWPAYRPSVTWSGELAELRQVKQSSGKLFRLFE